MTRARLVLVCSGLRGVALVAGRTCRCSRAAQAPAPAPPVAPRPAPRRRGAEEVSRGDRRRRGDQKAHGAFGEGHVRDSGAGHEGRSVHHGGSARHDPRAGDPAGPGRAAAGLRRQAGAGRSIRPSGRGCSRATSWPSSSTQADFYDDLHEPKSSSRSRSWARPLFEGQDCYELKLVTRLGVRVHRVLQCRHWPVRGRQAQRELADGVGARDLGGGRLQGVRRRADADQSRVSA